LGETRPRLPAAVSLAGLAYELLHAATVRDDRFLHRLDYLGCVPSPSNRQTQTAEEIHNQDGRLSLQAGDKDRVVPHFTSLDVEQHGGVYAPKKVAWNASCNLRELRTLRGIPTEWNAFPPSIACHRSLVVSEEIAGKLLRLGIREVNCKRDKMACLLARRTDTAICIFTSKRPVHTA